MPASLAPYERKTVTFDDAMNAMCVWAEISEMTRHDHPGTNPEWVEYHGNHGSFVLRQQSIGLGRYAAATWDIVDESAKEAHSFDYHFVPFLLSNLNWRNGEFELPAPAEMAAEVDDLFGFDNFLFAANARLKALYSVDFTNDVGMTRDEFRQAYWNSDPSERETVDEVVERYAAKYDLVRRDEGYGPRL